MLIMEHRDGRPQIDVDAAGRNRALGISKGVEARGWPCGISEDRCRVLP